MAVLRKISGVSLTDRYRNEEIRAALERELAILEIIHRRLLSYFGYVSRIKPERLPISNMLTWKQNQRQTKKDLVGYGEVGLRHKVSHVNTSLI